jgi:acetaldehyde dehydrogenase/alcohol dehydrogenase
MLLLPENRSNILSIIAESKFLLEPDFWWGRSKNRERRSVFERKTQSGAWAYEVGDFDDGLFHAAKLVDFAGSGHTAVLYTDQDSKEGEEQISRFGETMKAGRLLVNTPASQGAIGDLYNFKLEPSLTLGCGSWGKNSFCGNVGPKNLLNMVTLAKRQENTQWYKVPKEIYFKRGSLDVGLEELQKENRKRALIITDNPIFQLGMVRPVQEKLHSLGITTKIISDVKPNPDLHTIKKGLEQANSFQPDVNRCFWGWFSNGRRKNHLASV